jgi:hypothetical protein
MLPALIYLIALSASTRAQPQSRSMRTIHAQRTRIKSDVCPLIVNSSQRVRTEMGPLVVLNAISDILLQIHLRECGLL